jgi:hypothetical protein
MMIGDGSTYCHVDSDIHRTCSLSIELQYMYVSNAEADVPSRSRPTILFYDVLSWKICAL